MKYLFTNILLLIFLQSCGQIVQLSKGKIVHVVGEIFSDPKLDEADFQICGPQNQIIQYYAFKEKAFEGEKSAILQHFQEQYVPVEVDESGLARIRFVVNCEGKAGRFRLLAMDKAYQPTVFSPHITDQLLHLTRAFDGWKSLSGNGTKRDYYQYLIFKIEQGALIEIMP